MAFEDVNKEERVVKSHAGKIVGTSLTYDFVGEMS